MPAPHDSLRQHLVAATAELNLDVSDAQCSSLLNYVALLEKWNTVYNLTSVRDPAHMLSRHVVDCLAVIRPLQRQLGDKAARRILDVGSGAGLPGVVIAITCPDVDVTCVDAVGKKAAFIRQVAGELAVVNLHSVHARVEALALPGFDVVTSRAFAELATFVDLTQHLLGRDGVWMAMKSGRNDVVMGGVIEAVEVFHVEQLQVPLLDEARCVVWLRRQAPR